MTQQDQPKPTGTRHALYPGTFDPVTNGHLDVLQRATVLFDKVTIAIAPNPNKKPTFSIEKRLELLREATQGMPGVEATTLPGLTVDYARKLGATAIIRGLRAISDFEHEFQMAQMNRYLDDSIETIFLVPSQEFFYTSSHLIKDLSRFERDRIQRFVPANVLDALEALHREHSG